MRTSLDVQQFIDALPFSKLQRAILWLCFLVVAVDGFDTAAIGFIAPAIREEWHLSAAALAPLFGAGLFGLMAGALLFGPLADRLGRKTVLVGSVAFFGLASLASMAAPDLTWLIVLRFLTGLGLGGAMPNAVTLTSEYCPGARRSSLVTLMFCGFTVGSALGGLASAQILATFGWRGVLCIGGVLPLLLVPVLMRSLPESLRFLVLKRRAAASIDSIVLRLAPGMSSAPELTAHETSAHTPIRELFRAPFAFGTAMLWISFFMSLLIIYLISSWLPTLLHNAGASLSRASLVTATFQIGGTVGAILLGRLMDRLGAGRTLSFAYVAGAVFVILCGASSGQLWLLVLAVFGVGFCVSGSQVGANALAAAFYPTNSRATGVSWANAAGRSGAIVGSLSGGWLMSMQLDMALILSLLAVPALIAAVAIAVLGRVKARIEAQKAVVAGPQPVGSLIR
jgi:AAHS family 4-hydroxybenzoate transporter-like MFS transporter